MLRKGKGIINWIAYKLIILTDKKMCKMMVKRRKLLDNVIEIIKSIPDPSRVSLSNLIKFKYADFKMKLFTKYSLAYAWFMNIIIFILTFIGVSMLKLSWMIPYDFEFEMNEEDLKWKDLLSL